MTSSASSIPLKVPFYSLTFFLYNFSFPFVHSFLSRKRLLYRTNSDKRKGKVFPRRRLSRTTTTARRRNEEEGRGREDEEGGKVRATTDPQKEGTKKRKSGSALFFSFLSL